MASCATPPPRLPHPAVIAFAFFGLPSYGEDGKTIAALDAMPSELLDAARYRCGNDMVCSWAGSLACVDGISVIAGTGSMAYGEFAGRQARCGGWGELIGDEGSAYWIAREGMNLFSRMSDGRVARGPLHRLVRERFELSNDLTSVPDLRRRRRPPRAASPIRAARARRGQAGDAAAAGIFTRGAQELWTASSPPGVRWILLPSRAAVSHSGGVFNNVPAMVDAFRDGLAAAPYRFEYMKPHSRRPSALRSTRHESPARRSPPPP